MSFQVHIVSTRTRKVCTPVGLLDASGGGSRLASCLGGQLLAGRLASGGLAGGLLGASHFSCWFSRMMRACGC
jgi:hypothetical protein